MARAKASNIRRKEFRITPHLQQLIDELKEAGEFDSEAEVIKTAIIRMHKEYSLLGKIKPKIKPKIPETAEERIKNATFAGQREVEID